MMSQRDTSYAAVMARKNEIMKSSMGMDYDDFIQSPIAFDYERMMRETGYTLQDIIRIQRETKVGNTPLFELHNLTAAVRRISEPGQGARIFVKDEAKKSFLFLKNNTYCLILNNRELKIPLKIYNTAQSSDDFFASCNAIAYPKPQWFELE